MKRMLVAATVVIALGSILPSVAVADGPINLCLFNPVQILKEDQAVKAFRFSLIYGVNTDLTGLDLSLVGINRGSVLGIQWAGVGRVEGDFTGWQAGIFHTTGGHFSGFQSGIYNGVSTGTGFQWGWVNTADQFSGFQLGLVNITEAMTSGLQIGLVNIINTKSKLNVFPIVNWKF